MNRYNFKKLALGILYFALLILIYKSMEDYTFATNNVATSISVQDLDYGIIAEDEYNIYIDLTESLLYLFKGDKFVKKYVVAQGKPSSPSPIGIWRIANKARNWGPEFGSRWMGLNVPWGLYGIHGTDKPGSIGYRASAGCFRMHNNDVEELYDIVPNGTIVIVDGGQFGNLGSGLEILEPGARQSHVIEVQKRLKNLGYYDNAIDGIYGEGMKRAIINFKMDNGLPISHTIDMETYEALGIILFE
ncbi:MAG TPA: L,D-transpeptidase family protein [Clostridiales bacterium]|nr:L,D-transpeptidase family protein [Clostridiales bacterium]